VLLFMTSLLQVKRVGLLVLVFNNRKTRFVSIMLAILSLFFKVSLNFGPADSFMYNVSTYLYCGLPPVIGRCSHSVSTKPELLEATFSSQSDSRAFIQGSEPIDINRSSPQFAYQSILTNSVTGQLDIYYFETFIVALGSKADDSANAVLVGLTPADFAFSAGWMDRLGSSILLNTNSGEIIVNRQSVNVKHEKFGQFKSLINGDVVGLVSLL
jgi:hypothetical protein